MILKKNFAFLVITFAIFGGFLSPVLSFGLAFASSEEGGDTGDGGDSGDGGGDNGAGDQPDPEPEPEPELDPDPDPDLGLIPGPEPPVDPCEENREAEGCAPEPPIDPCIDPTAEGCEPEPPICKPCPPGQICPDVCEPPDPIIPIPPPKRNCDSSYPDTCIPSPPPDLNCDDISFRNFKVIGNDPHGFDGDKDGVGCEGGGSSSGGSNDKNDDGGSSSANECQGQADCFRGTVTEIVDGDTIDINNVRVRLALVNTPERGDNGYTEAIDFVESVCGVGTKALVDEDDGQKEGSFDRLIGLAYCGDDGINNKKSLNEFLLERGYAVIYQDFCSISEFSSASWAQRYGC